MQQGYITDSEWARLTNEEKKSLAAIRLHFINENYLSEGVNSQRLVDTSFEAMGRRFRSRINRKIALYGRYTDDKYDGVFLIIQGAIRDYDIGNKFFPPKVSDARQIYQEFQCDKDKFDKRTTKSIENLSTTIEWLKERALLKYEVEQLSEAETALARVAEILESQRKQKDSIKRPHSAVERFINSICSFLVWFADIKPTKAVTESGDKTPLLRFLEVFYPLEAEAALSSLYEKQKRAAPHEKIGSSFIPVK